MTYPLREILADYRATVEKAWTADTAHEGYEGAAGSPVGQCGVTSAWLQRRLLEVHGYPTWYCEGFAYHGPEWTEVHHCWLAFGAGRVIDLTADQFPAPVMAYLPSRVLTADIAGDEPVQERLALLTEAVGS